MLHVLEQQTGRPIDLCQLTHLAEQILGILCIDNQFNMPAKATLVLVGFWFTVLCIFTVSDFNSISALCIFAGLELELSNGPLAPANAKFT